MWCLSIISNEWKETRLATYFFFSSKFRRPLLLQRVLQLAVAPKLCRQYSYDRLQPTSTLYASSFVFFRYGQWWADCLLIEWMNGQTYFEKNGTHEFYIEEKVMRESREATTTTELYKKKTKNEKHSTQLNKLTKYFIKIY